jgi:uncharacterized protein (TIGR02231 family)
MMSLTIDTQITAVTVYTDRALVTRQGTIQLAGTEHELLLTQLPTTLDPESVRVSGRGDVAVKLQGVTTDRQYTIEPVIERIAELTERIDRLESDKRQLQYQINTIALQSSFIYGLREKTETTFSRSLASQQIGLEDTQNLIDFIGTKNSEYALATEDLQQQQRQIEKQLKAIQMQLREIQTPNSKESLELRVAIEPAGAGEFQLEVVYVVSNASWIPLYDLRVQSAKNPPLDRQVRHEHDMIQLNYLAEITQTTGEDWSNVNLLLSTAKPGLGTIPPKLDPWYVDTPKAAKADWMTQEVNRLVSVAAPAPMMSRARAGGSSAAEEEDTPTVKYVAETVVAEVSQQGSVVTFQLVGGINIPSDGNPHKATILQDSFPCRLEYIAMPRLVSFAYLQTKAKNRADGAALLPGKANIFRDDMFVGMTNLENISPGQEFKLNLGVDEGIKIDRELIERQVDKKFLGGNRRITCAYRLTVTNLLATVNRIHIDDQIPHSRNEQIKVKLLKATPQIQLGELGKLNWELEVPANGKTEIYYQFSIEHPEHIQVTGFDI